MPTTQRVIVAAFVLATSLLSQLAEAGPVQIQEGVTAPTVEPGLGNAVTAPALPAAGTILSPARTDPQGPASPGLLGSSGAAADPSAGALAAEILREADAGAAAAAPTAAPRGRRDSVLGNTQTAAKQAQPPDLDGAGELRQIGKAAMHWLRGAVPGLGGEDGESTDAAHRVEWSNSRADGHSSTTGMSAEAALAERRARAQILSQPDTPGSATGERQASFEGGHNLAREAIRGVQEVLAHPMTWLVIAIFVIGGIAMSLADRRPK